MRDVAAAALLRAGVLQFGEFTLVSGQPSPYYVDLRRLQSFPREMVEVANAMVEMMRGQGLSWVDRIAGLPEAAGPLATAISLSTGIPMITPRKQTKDYGMRTPIDGVYEDGQNVWVVDDVITKAKTKLEFIAILEGAGLKVPKVSVVVDREQGGISAMLGACHPCDALFTTSDLIELYGQRGAVDEVKLSAVRDYIASEGN
jgi:uridine monophosphate synthetase